MKSLKSSWDAVGVRPTCCMRLPAAGPELREFQVWRGPTDAFEAVRVKADRPPWEETSPAGSLSYSRRLPRGAGCCSQVTLLAWLV